MPHMGGLYYENRQVSSEKMVLLEEAPPSPQVNPSILILNDLQLLDSRHIRHCYPLHQGIAVCIDGGKSFPQRSENVFICLGEAGGDDLIRICFPQKFLLLDKFVREERDAGSISAVDGIINFVPEFPRAAVMPPAIVLGRVGLILQGAQAHMSVLRVRFDQLRVHIESILSVP